MWNFECFERGLVPKDAIFYSLETYEISFLNSSYRVNCDLKYKKPKRTSFDDKSLIMMKKLLFLKKIILRVIFNKF